MAASAFSAVIGRIGDLVIQESSLLCGVTAEVGLLKDELERVQGYLEDADNKMRSGRNVSVATCVRQLRDATYEAENVFEAAEHLQKRNRLKKGFTGAISRYACFPCDLVALHKIDSEVRRVKRKISAIVETMEKLEIVKLDTNKSDNIDDDVPFLPNVEDNAFFGFEDDYKEIVGKLVDKENNNLSVVSLVATGGAGKTTLATKVFKSFEVKQHFGKVAWVTLSQKFKGIDLLKDILKQIVGPKDEFRVTDEIKEDEVRKKIHKFLLLDRYLVVLDDVWELDTWEQVNGKFIVFPDANNGSKVLLTTRKQDVANHIQMPTYVHHLKLMGEKDSQDLFTSKALPSYIRSTIPNLSEFEKLGNELVEKCDGLPLALAVLGGYLSKNLDIDKWSYLLLDWPSTTDGQMMGVILRRSYNDLSDQRLKSCFLYLASFPEDYSVPVKDLIELWIAEWFIPYRPKHTREKTARRYLADLAQRNLVQVGQEIDSVEFSAIRIHDILRDWCIDEARKDGFLGVIDKTAAGQVGASSSDTMAPYRSCFHNFCDDRTIQATPNLRTLIGFELSALSLPKLRSLKVLHVENSTFENLELIHRCIYLRYLRLRNCRGVRLPSSIGQLLYLQTVDLRDTHLGSVIPVTIWAIPTLRHLYLGDKSCPPGTFKRDTMQILEKLPYLAVLHIWNYRGTAMSCSAKGFPQLQELVLGQFITRWTIEVSAMPMLSYLGLRNCQLGKLPKGLLHLPSFKMLAASQRSDLGSDNTWRELEMKGRKIEVEGLPLRSSQRQALCDMGSTSYNNQNRLNIK